MNLYLVPGYSNNMCKLTLTAGLCLIIASLASSSKLVCYYNSLAENRTADGKITVPDLNPDYCTHLIYGFSDINNQHELVPSNEADIQQYQSFNGLKTRNPLLKTLLAVGGLTFDTRKFSQMATSQSNRAKFIQSAITLLRANEFDGINLDWRFPGGAGSQPQDKQSFTLLCQELKEAFVAEGASSNRDRLIVAASVSAERATIDAGYEVAKIAEALDFINVLTFDFHGLGENVTGHHSPLYKGSQDTGDKTYSNTDSAMQYWQVQGAPSQKLLLGLAAYGQAFTLSSVSSNVGAPASGPGEEGCFTDKLGFWAYYETCIYLDGVTTQVIPDQKVPFATAENQWVGFDNKDSLDTKVSYLKANNFGGAFVWSLDLDDVSGKFCKQGNYPFTSHLHSLLVQGSSGQTTPTSTPRNTSTPITTSPTTTTQTPTTTTTSPTTTTTQTPTTTTTSPTTTPTQTPTTTTTSLTTTTTQTPTTTTTTTTTAEGSSGNPCDGKSDGVYTNPNDPGSFYNCANGRFYIQQCFPGLVFDKSCDCCVWP